MKTKTLLLAAFMCLFSLSLFSQEDGTIIYTDFEPDSIISPIEWDSSGGSPIDINFDGENDFVFEKSFSSSQLHHTLRIFTDWKLKATSENNPKPMTEYSNWTNELEMLGFDNFYYIALRHWIKDVGFCYGWFRYEYYGDSIVINDMAYCTIPNYPLKFGQRSFTDDVAEIDGVNSQYELYPNPVDDRLVLKFSDDFKCEYIMIYSIDGRMIKLQDADFENIDVSTLERGMYLIRIRTEEGKDFVEKIVVK